MHQSIAANPAKNAGHKQILNIKFMFLIPISIGRLEGWKAGEHPPILPFLPCFPLNISIMRKSRLTYSITKAGT